MSLRQGARRRHLFTLEFVGDLIGEYPPPGAFERRRLVQGPRPLRVKQGICLGSGMRISQGRARSAWGEGTVITWTIVSLFVMEEGSGFVTPVTWTRCIGMAMTVGRVRMID